MERILSCEDSRELAIKICTSKLKGADPKIVKHNLGEVLKSVGSAYIERLDKICDLNDAMMEIRSRVIEDLKKEKEVVKTKKGVSLVE